MSDGSLVLIMNLSFSSVPWVLFSFLHTLFWVGGESLTPKVFTFSYLHSRILYMTLLWHIQLSTGHIHLDDPLELDLSLPFLFCLSLSGPNHPTIHQTSKKLRCHPVFLLPQSTSPLHRHHHILSHLG